MHTYFLAAAFLSAVTASPLPDFSPLGYVPLTSDQPNDVPIPFPDFFAQTSTNPDNYNLEQSQILAQSPGINLDSNEFAQPQVLAQNPSTNSDSYNLVQPQILVESYEEGMPETVRGDDPAGNEPIPLPTASSAEKCLPSDRQFQRAPCDATSSVCCQRDYNGEDSKPATCAASMRFQSPFSYIRSPVCALEIGIEFAGSDASPVKDFGNPKFGRYCLAPKYFSDCNRLWSWVRVSLYICVPPFSHRIYQVCPFTAGIVQDRKR